MILVFDSNVWVSAFRFGGTPLRALDTALRDHTIAYCQEIRVEVERNLHLKFGMRVQFVSTLMAPYLTEGIRVIPTGRLRGVCRDRSDNIIVECAVLANAEILVTGDKDLLTLRTYGNVMILSPTDVLAVLSPTEP